MRRSSYLGVLGLLALGLSLACSKDKGNEPEPVEYRVYLGTADTRHLDPVYKFYIYDPDSLVLLDSLPVTEWPLEAGVSADGNTLYVLRDRHHHGYYYGVAALDARTGEEFWSVDTTDRTFSLLNGGSLIISGNIVLSASDGSEVWRIPDTLRMGDGPTSGTRIAAIVTDPNGNPWVSDTLVTALDVATHTTSGAFVPRLSTGEAVTINNARLHPDGQRVCVIGTRNGYWFMVGDLVTGSVLLGHRLYSPYGEIAINEQGTRCVTSDPSTGCRWDTPMGIDVFDLVSLEHLMRFSEGFGISVGQVRFLPGGENVLVTGSAGTCGSAYFINELNVIDLEAVRRITGPLGLSTSAGGLAVGPAPQ
jgi:hypothetical protein